MAEKSRICSSKVVRSPENTAAAFSGRDVGRRPGEPSVAGKIGGRATCFESLAYIISWNPGLNHPCLLAARTRHGSEAGSTWFAASRIDDATAQLGSSHPEKDIFPVQGLSTLAMSETSARADLNTALVAYSILQLVSSWPARAFVQFASAGWHFASSTRKTS